MKKKPKRGAPKGNDNAAKPKKEKRVLVQVRVAPDAAALLAKHTKDHDNAGRALDFAIRQTWAPPSPVTLKIKVGPARHEGTHRVEITGGSLKHWPTS